MMFYLYILKSTNQNRHYIGITGNMSKRLEKHNSGGVQSTKAYRPWKVIYQEQYRDKTSARKRELYLKKTAAARRELFSKYN